MKKFQSPVKNRLGIGLGFVFLTIVLYLVIASPQIFKVSGDSMYPTIKDGDYKIVYNSLNKNPERGDIVVVDSPDVTGKQYIKRVIALEGDTLSFKDDRMFLNGKQVEEPYLDPLKSEQTVGTIITNDFSLEILGNGKVVPKGEVFVLGDNRLDSKDSRDFGTFKKGLIKGIVHSIK